MNLKKTLLPLLAIFVLGCSSNDNDIIPNQEPEAASFLVIGEDAENVYQYNYDAETNIGASVDLSSELGISSNYLTLRQTVNLISFFSFSEGFFSLSQKNINTGQISNYNNFYENNQGRSIVWGDTNETNVFFGYFGPNGSRNLSIQDIELSTNERFDVTIDFNIETVYQPLFFEDRIYFAYRDNQDNSRFTFYDVNTKSAGPKLDFGETTISFFVAGDSTIGIIKNGLEASLELYDSINLDFLERFSLDFDSGFSPGPVLEMALVNNMLFYAKPFIQPSRFPFGPAVFDLDRQEDRILDLEGIVMNLEQEMGSNLTLTFQTYNTKTNLFMVGYGLLGNEIKGGILQISNAGKLISNIEFPFFPTYMVRD